MKQETFEEWLVKVDTALVERIGLPHDQIEDWDWRNAFDSSFSPMEAIDEMMDDYVGYPTKDKL